MMLLGVSAAVNQLDSIFGDAASLDEISLNYFQNLLTRSPSFAFGSVGKHYASDTGLILDLDSKVIEPGCNVAVAKLSKLVKLKRAGDLVLLC
jgi:hypothetical protein